ncbi:hypothetical protein BN873_320015 [Candidatus Competibacter denitrificans Run_A_D11]|uniref:Uncharacterized protein n=1 Tax=Candidatus Competibacter denitrificans Run_A_D11 TaxID=1400863 RepID=W6MD69_9GAMM|nr:hypothetical protein BN873_320015 [Candidatus Competibacter denitrificans Run_A_D11]
MLNGVVIVNAPDTSVSSFPTVEHLHNRIYSLAGGDGVGTVVGSERQHRANDFFLARFGRQADFGSHHYLPSHKIAHHLSVSHHGANEVEGW